MALSKNELRKYKADGYFALSTASKVKVKAKWPKKAKVTVK